jgi:hypothetical protein
MGTDVRPILYGRLLAVITVAPTNRAGIIAC